MTEPIREADQGVPPVEPPAPRKLKSLPAIEEEFNDAAALIRLNVVSLSADFAYGTDEAEKERKKLENFIRLLAQQHLKAMAQSLKLLVTGIVKGEVRRATDAIMAHTGSLLAGQVAMAEERGRIWRGEAPEESVLVSTEPPAPGLLGADGQPVNLPATPDDSPGRVVMDGAGHTEAPAGGTQ